MEADFLPNQPNKVVSQGARCGSANEALSHRETEIESVIVRARVDT